MKKIILICQKKVDNYERYAVYFHGWLMSKVSNEFAEEIHQTGVNPLNITVRISDDKIRFIVGLLTSRAIAEVESILLAPDFQNIELKATQQKNFTILDKIATELTETELTKNFYLNDMDNITSLNFYTPTAFKTQGEYYFLPDVRLLFQSLMKKYNAIFEGSERIDVELLDEIVKRVTIINFRISSRRYYIHRAYINGFIGRVTLICKGNQTLTNYVSMLLKFGEYSGVGVKTSLGMGAFELTRKGEKTHG